MIKKIVLIASFCVHSSFAVCEEPTTGTAVWQLAADALGLICPIESKVSQLQADVDIGFAGTFTVTEQIFEKVCTVASQTDVIDSKVDVLTNYCGIPIYVEDLPLIITTPERYFLAENIDYTGAFDAITIASDNVFLCLNGRTLNYSGMTSSIDGVMITTATNVQVVDGTISNFTGHGINVSGGENMLFLNLNITDIGATGLNIGATNVIVNKITTLRCDNGIAFASSSRNHCLKNSFLIDSQTRGALMPGTNSYINNSTVHVTGSTGISFGELTTNFLAQGITVTNAGGMGMQTGAAQTISGWIVIDSTFNDNGNNGINYDHDEAIIMRSTFIGNQSDGVCFLGANDPANSYIAFNTAIGNADTNYRISSGTNAQTILGNFAFNSTAVGNPPNSNYRPSASNITGKFVTGSEGGSFGDFPTQWHNINMLP